MRDICSELIVKAIASDPVNPYIKATTNRISFSVFDLGTNNLAFDPIGADGDHLSLNEIFSKSKLLTSLRSNTNPDSMKHYFMIYASNFNPHTVKGIYKEDSERGIYHLYFGADRGIVKNIDFQKTDMQYLKEARIVDQNRVRKNTAFFIEPYNAKIPLYGVSVFKPGMMVYIDPKSIGIDLTIPRNERIPLGGYYNISKVFGKIEPGVFETIIDLNWISFVEENSLFNANLSQDKELSIDVATNV